MAIDRRYLLDLLARVKTFDSNREWEGLSVDEKNLLEEFAIYYGSEKGIDTASGYDLLTKLKNPKLSHNLLAIIQSLESIEVSFDNVTVGTIPPEILAEYQEYLKQVRLRSSTPGVISPQMSLAETIKKAQYFYQIRLKAEAARVAHLAVSHPDLDPKRDIATITTIINAEVKENNDVITTAANQQKASIESTTIPVGNVSTLYVEKVAAALNLTLTDTQKNEAVLTLASFIYSGGVEDFVDPLTDDLHKALVPEKINLASRNLVGATSFILRETLTPSIPSANNKPHEKAQEELQSFFQSGTIPASSIDQFPSPSLSQTTIDQIETISASIVASDYLAPEILQSASQNVYQIQLKVASSGLARYASIDLPSISETEIETIIRAYQYDHPGQLITPTLIQTYNTQKTIAAIKATDPSNKNHLSGIEAYHRGVHLDVIRAITNAKPGSKLERLANEKPSLFTRLVKVVHPIEISPLGQSGEISTPTHPNRIPSSNSIRRFYDSTVGAASRGLGRIVDSVGSRNPALGRVLNAIRSPLQSALRPVFAWAGRQAGIQAARQFIQNIAAKAIGKIASEGVKKLAQTIISEGLKQGLKTLIIQGAAALGIDLAAAATGVGLPVAVIMIIIQVSMMAIGMAVDFVKKNNKEIGEQIVGATVLFSTAISAFFSSMVAVAVATGMTLITISIVSILLGTTMYIAVNNIAPIITTLAHLESGLVGVSGGTAENFVPEPGIECDGILPAENNDSASAVARKAYEITSGLKAGFWNYCNYHPAYPELFNFQLFAENPNPPYPGPIQNSAANLFWCTQLTAKAYGFAPGNSYSASGQMNAVNFQAIAGLRYSDVQSGDIVFINVGNSSRIANHVGVVYAVTEDAIVYLQSNAATKTANIPVSTDGTIEGVIGRIAILGFGKP